MAFSSERVDPGSLRTLDRIPRLRVAAPAAKVPAQIIFMETTCVLIKPDAMRAHHIGAIIDRFERAGLAITDAKMISLDAAVLAEHYAHIVDKPFYPEVEEFMRSAPVLALAIAGDGAVAKVRTLAGATNPEKADPGTIRKDFGTDVMVNALHASDSVEAAEAELVRFGVGAGPA